MEQLAALVLTGDGHRLIGRHSTDPELQAFIDNVPTYMVGTFSFFFNYIYIYIYYIY